MNFRLATAHVYTSIPHSRACWGDITVSSLTLRPFLNEKILNSKNKATNYPTIQSIDIGAEKSDPPRTDLYSIRFRQSSAPPHLHPKHPVWSSPTALATVYVVLHHSSTNSVLQTDQKDHTTSWQTGIPQILILIRTSTQTPALCPLKALYIIPTKLTQHLQYRCLRVLNNHLTLDFNATPHSSRI
jgi:hypothetical protein